jgi:Ca2+-binding EF-hand superfamily protein
MEAEHETMWGAVQPLHCHLCLLGRGDMASMDERKTKLLAAFAALDSKKTGKVPTKLVLGLVQKFDPKMTDQEKSEFEQEADQNGFIEYDSFVKNVIFGKAKS